MAAAVVSAAAVIIPLTAGSASAVVTDPDGFHLSSGSLTHEECQYQGRLSLEQNGYTEFQCRWNPRTSMWEEWVR